MLALAECAAANLLIRQSVFHRWFSISFSTTHPRYYQATSSWFYHWTSLFRTKYCLRCHLRSHFEKFTDSRSNLFQNRQGISNIGSLTMTTWAHLSRSFCVEDISSINALNNYQWLVGIALLFPPFIECSTVNFFLFHCYAQLAHMFRCVYISPMAEIVLFNIQTISATGGVFKCIRVYPW